MFWFVILSYESSVSSFPMLADLVTKSLDFPLLLGPVKFSLENIKSFCFARFVGTGSPHKNTVLEEEFGSPWRAQILYFGGQNYLNSSEYGHSDIVKNKWYFRVDNQLKYIANVTPIFVLYVVLCYFSEERCHFKLYSEYTTLWFSGAKYTLCVG